ncbi:MAG: hypothetical protein Q9182_001828 [Xanthomendoza sp. 2 TL-2023]
MPDILYTWNAPPARANYKPPGVRGAKYLPPPKLDAQGNTMYERWPLDDQKPRKLLDFKHLPDQIGTNEWWWVFEAWRRWIDILMRQHGPSRSNANTLQMLVCRNRPAYMMTSWEPQPRSLGHKTKDTVSQHMTAQQRQNNTTRGLTPGIMNPQLPDVPANRVPLPERVMATGKLAGPKITDGSDQQMKKRSHKGAFRSKAGKEKIQDSEEEPSGSDPKNFNHPSVPHGKPDGELHIQKRQRLKSSKCPHILRLLDTNTALKSPID